MDRRFKTIRQILVFSLCLLLLTSCATLQQKWNSATEDEKARVLLYGFQKTVKTLLESGIIYIQSHPDKKPEWQSRIIPIFDAVNKTLFDLEAQGATGQKITVLSVTLAVTGRIVEIQTILAGWGIKI